MKSITSLVNNLREEFGDFLSTVAWGRKNNQWMSCEDVTLKIVKHIDVKKFANGEVPEEVVEFIFRFITFLGGVSTRKSTRQRTKGYLFERTGETYEDTLKEYKGTLTGNIMHIEERVKLVCKRIQWKVNQHTVSNYPLTDGYGHKNKEELLKTLNSIFTDYVDELWQRPDPTLLKEDYYDIWEMQMQLTTDEITVDEILCVSDVLNASPHKHLFEKREPQNLLKKDKRDKQTFEGFKF